MAEPQPRRSKFFAGAFRAFRRIRVLSLDGAGIYGLTEAMLLEQLCRRDETFLTEGNISLFAGCSAGAANALILASYERPRDAIESGALRALWMDERSWVPPPFPNNLTGLLGMAPWMSKDKMMEALRDIFEDKRLRDLPHSTVITTYAYSGYGHLKGTDQDLETPHRPPSWPGAELLNDWLPWLRPYLTWMQPQPTEKLKEIYRENPSWTWYDDPDPLAAQRSSHTVPGMVLTDSYRHWQPRLFHHINLGGYEASSCDADVDVAELAYAAMAPFGFRYQLGGLGDGAAFNMNPTPYAYAQLTSHLHEQVLNQEMDELMPLRQEGHSESEHQLERQSASRVYEPALSVLSVGAGDRMPFLWPPNSALGIMSSQMWPTNPGGGVFHPPGTFSLQGGDAGADVLMRHIMGPRYARLNPPVMSMPLLYSALVARFKPTRTWVCDTIERRVGSSEVQRALDTVDRYFLKSDRYWADEQVWVGAPLGPLPSPEDDELLENAIDDLNTETELVTSPATPPPGVKPL